MIQNRLIRRVCVVALRVKSGVELDRLLTAIEYCQMLGPNASLRRRFPEMLFKGQFLPSRFFLKLAHKDYRLASELAAKHRVPTRVISLCEQEHLEALGRGWGEEERVKVNTLQEARSGVELRTDFYEGRV